MRVLPSPSQVRTMVAGSFRDLGVPVANSVDLDERVRIDDGRCVARTWRAGGFMAMWLIDVGIVQFYDEDGNMVTHINLSEETTPRRMAA